eukprot:284129-Pelagomonas_calceolata.AAC.11
MEVREKAGRFCQGVPRWLDNRCEHLATTRWLAQAGKQDLYIATSRKLWITSDIKSLRWDGAGKAKLCDGEPWFCTSCGLMGSKLLRTSSAFSQCVGAQTWLQKLAEGLQRIAAAT